MASAVPAIDGNSFTALFVGQFIGLIDRRYSSFFAEIDGLAYRCIAVLLKGSLHPDMPFRLDIIGTSEDSSYSSGYLGDFLYTAGLGNLFFQVFTVKMGIFSSFPEDRVYLQHL